MELCARSPHGTQSDRAG